MTIKIRSNDSNGPREVQMDAAIFEKFSGRKSEPKEIKKSDDLPELLTLLSAAEYLFKQEEDKGTPAPSEGTPEYAHRGKAWDYTSSTPAPEGAETLQTSSGKAWWRVGEDSEDEEESLSAEEKLTRAIYGEDWEEREKTGKPLKPLPLKKVPLTPEEEQQKKQEEDKQEEEEAADWAKNQPIEAKRLFDEYGLDPDTGATEILQLVRSYKVDHDDARLMLNLRPHSDKRYQRGRWFADYLGPPKSAHAPIGYIDIDAQEVQNAAAMAVLSHPSPEGISSEYVVSSEEAASVIPFWSPGDEKSADEAASDLPPVGEGKVRLFRGGRDIKVSDEPSGEIDFSEKFSIKPLTEEEISTSTLASPKISSMGGEFNERVGEEISRYWSHQPPKHPTLGRLGPAEDGGIQAYKMELLLKPGLDTEFKDGADQKVIWLDTYPHLDDDGNTSPNFITIDATKLNLGNVVTSGAGSVYGGDIPVEAIVRGFQKEKVSTGLREIIRSDPKSKHVMDTLATHGRPYIIGGSVRDSLLGIPSKDIDIEVYGIPEDELSGIVGRDLGGKQDQVGKAFGVFKVGNFDIALPRTETATGTKHTDFDVKPDPNLPVEEAARRRDFTINAMMYDYSNDEILDFFGGQDDIAAKVIKHVDPETFVEDPLRVYRAAQFAARFGFTIDPSTQELAKSMDLSDLPKERVFTEFEKMMLKSPEPSVGLDALDSMGVLDGYFSEISDLKGTVQRDDYHAEGDVYTHTKMVMDKASEIIKRESFDDKDKMIIMTACLLHDIGKPATTDTKTGQAIGHEEAGVEVTRSILSRLTDDKEIVDTVSDLVENHLRPAQYTRGEGASDAAYRRLINKHGLKFVDLLAAVSEADVTGRLHRNESGEIEKPDGAEVDAFRARVKEVSEGAGIKEGRLAPLISGNDLKDLGFEEGRELGDILRDVKGKQEEGELASAEDALKYVGDVYKSVEMFTLLAAIEFLYKQQDQGTPAPAEGTPEYQGRGSVWDYTSSTPAPDEAQILHTSSGKQWWRVGQDQEPEKQTAEQKMMGRVGDIELPDEYVPGMFEDQLTEMNQDDEFVAWFTNTKAHIDHLIPSGAGYIKPYSTSEIMLLMEHRDSKVAQLAFLRYQAAKVLGTDFINHFAENLKMPEGGIKEFEKQFPSSRFVNKVLGSLKTTDKDPTVQLSRIVDELYSNTKFSTIHAMAKKDWESNSTGGYFSWALQESVGRQFDGDVKYFGGRSIRDEDEYDFTEGTNLKTRDTLWRGKGMGPVPSQDEIDEYVRVHRDLSRWMLDVAFPRSDTITLYRGTTDNEVGSRDPNVALPDWGEKAVIENQNPLTSWTTKPEVAFKFSTEQSRNNWLLETSSYEETKDEMQGGTFTVFDRAKEAGEGEGSIRSTVVLKAEISKDAIFTHFGSYAYHGNEKEFTVMNTSEAYEVWDWRDSAASMATELDPGRKEDWEDELPEDISSYTWTDWAKEWEPERKSVHPRLWDTLDDESKQSIDPDYDPDYEE